MHWPLNRTWRRDHDFSNLIAYHDSRFLVIVFINRIPQCEHKGGAGRLLRMQSKVRKVCRF